MSSELIPASDPDRRPQRSDDETVIYVPAAIMPGTGVVRRPVIAPWLRNPEHRRAAARWAVANVTHTAAFHALRVHMYAGRTVKYSPRGLWRVVAATWVWVLDREAADLRVHAVEAKDPAAYMRLSKQRNDRVKRRGIAVAAAMAGAVITVEAADHVWWRYAWLLAALFTVAVLGWCGRRLDKPFLDEAVLSSPGAARLTPDVVSRALASLGIAGISQAVAKGQPITFAGPVHRDGPGWRAEVDLPHGVTAVDVIERRARLASGLRRPLGCVWPEPVHDIHEGRLVLWVGDRDMAQAKPAPYPLAKTGATSIFVPLPFGTDQRGRPVTVELVFNSMLIGSIPRQGKTMAVRVLALGAALDVTTELRVWELKGTGDLSSLEAVAHRYGSGVDDANISACVADLRDAYRDLERRAKAIRGLPKDVCPENKITPQLAARKSLGLHPVLIIVDEAQELPWKDAEELCLGLIKRGPALGIMLVLATQRPDKDSLPTGISANAGVRFCLRVMDQTANDMVLGTSAYKTGVRATTFTVRDKGCGYLIGAAEEPQVTRTYYVDAPGADVIAGRARQLREGAGRLTGRAAGEDQAPGETVSLLADVAAVFSGEEELWSRIICGRLAELRPGMYHGWTAETLAKALAVYGVLTVQLHRRQGGGNRRGVRLADVLVALAPAAGSTAGSGRNDP